MLTLVVIGDSFVRFASAETWPDVDAAVARYHARITIRTTEVIDNVETLSTKHNTITGAAERDVLTVADVAC